MLELVSVGVVVLTGVLAQGVREPSSTTQTSPAWQALRPHVVYIGGDVQPSVVPPITVSGRSTATPNTDQAIPRGRSTRFGAVDVGQWVGLKTNAKLSAW